METRSGETMEWKLEFYRGYRDYVRDDFQVVEPRKISFFLIRQTMPLKRKVLRYSLLYIASPRKHYWTEYATAHGTASL